MKKGRVTVLFLMQNKKCRGGSLCPPKKAVEGGTPPLRGYYFHKKTDGLTRPFLNAYN